MSYLTPTVQETTNANTMMALGLPAEPALAIAAGSGTDDMMRLGIPAELAKVITAKGTAREMMGLGMAPALADAVKTVIGS